MIGEGGERSPIVLPLRSGGRRTTSTRFFQAELASTRNKRNSRNRARHSPGIAGKILGRGGGHFQLYKHESVAVGEGI